MLARASRRLLVSPWFAAGAGVVIATGAIVLVPHNKLAVGISHCSEPGGASCTKLVPQEAPLQAGPGKPVTTPPSKSSAPASMTVWYQPLTGSTQYGFSMWIKFRAPRSPQWRLSFVIPGARNVYVYGAPRWQPSGTDGVTVSSYTAGTESAGSAGIAGHQDGTSGGSSATGGTVEFQVRGMGTPGAPVGCSFSLGSCQFRPSRDLAPSGWPGTG
jgi:hypothetical protein